MLKVPTAKECGFKRTKKYRDECRENGIDPEMLTWTELRDLDYNLYRNVIRDNVRKNTQEI